MRVLILIACLLHVACAAPQFVTFKDGKIGVNFGGYHASAGLGGLLTGNAAHGGLSADAGTPWGPKAAAGIGGGLDGRTAGVAYAGAEANPEVGASAVIGGSVNEGGFLGSEAHANGKVSSNSLSSVPDRMYSDAPAPSVVQVPENTNSIQKIKPPKKYSLIKRDRKYPDLFKNPEKEPVVVAHSKHLVKSVQKSVVPPLYPVEAAAGGETRVHVNSGLVGNVLNIPIGILRSLQDSLVGFQVDKSVNFAHSG